MLRYIRKQKNNVFGKFCIMATKEVKLELFCGIYTVTRITVYPICCHVSESDIFPCEICYTGPQC